MQNLPSGRSNNIYYPDGTWAPRPHDGYVFVDQKGNRWKFDGFSDDWFMDKNVPFNMFGGLLDHAKDEPLRKIEKKCECGSEIAKVDGHSKWCPKYET